MTNIFAVLYLSFTTNCCGVASLPDGNRLCEYCVIANVEVNHVMPDGVTLKSTTQVPYSRFSVMEPAIIPKRSAFSPIPIPKRSAFLPVLTRSLRTLPPPPSTALAMPFQILSPRFANGGQDETNNAGLMFRVDFPTETNHIYGLELSRDLVHWEARPPEIDGTGQLEFFFDAIFVDANNSYRVVSREGVLPQEP